MLKNTLAQCCEANGGLTLKFQEISNIAQQTILDIICDAGQRR